MAPDSTTLGPGFRFHPTDEELVRFYLKRKVTGKPFRFDHIAVVDVYKFEPWDLPSKSKLKTRDLEWYFFSALDRKYGSGSRTNRATEKGYWKTTGKDRPIKQGERTVGMKKTLVYHSGRAPRGLRTNWVMHEYKMVDEQLAQAGILLDAYVLCRIFEKSGAGPKNGEKYGAPLIEEEWEEEDLAATLPVADKPVIGTLSAGEVGAFVETDDFDQKLDTGVATGNVVFPSNFFHGECSSYPQHSQEFIIQEDQKPLIGADGTCVSENGQGFQISEHDAVDINSVKNGDNGELSHDQSPPSFNYEFDYLDLFLDATDYPLSSDDGAFLETNDLLNHDAGNSNDADPSGTDMVDEYLAYSDDDITKYINFDSPETSNVEGETNDINMTNKHGFEAHSSNEASDLKLASENTNPFVKQANKLLASIPAPPAFASEFPSKEIALQLHSAAQSSNSAHVTAGMVSITNITLRGNAMDLMVGKNGGFSTIISTGFSQSDIDSSAMMPVSGLLCRKTAYMLSHGWVFMMFFSFLILSMSYKIGSLMYAGK